MRVRGSYVRIGGDGLKWTRGHMLTPIFCPLTSCLLPATTASLLQLSISLLLQNCLLTVQLFENCLTVVKTCESATGTTLGGSLINHRGATLATGHLSHPALCCCSSIAAAALCHVLILPQQTALPPPPLDPS